MFKYRTDSMHSPKIEKREISKETEKSIFWINSRGKEERELKRTQWQNWFDTWEEAHQFILQRAQGRVDSLRRQLEGAKGILGNIKGMKP